ncbi:adenylate kinase [Propionibacterium freudenreichii]|uniref:adenylate kinase n=1 Tax=Propionibacterium freudenreichii TaxID=1744 RepID=UPI00054388F4|nr:adenylate kinase [Propionibacterium freudenreichii]MCT2995633.1 adenylate kinase [Propionibacterium freudenreichii]MDK9342216.1 adenylate kinase [Propionibacterium freudenreichii]WFF31401.1 adenylate kinase [Propionibacterium freudenreichii]CEG89106.1 Adenylate kinase (ATP-AMP transphosphorylase) [Propionibacterium freudenreichii]
MRLLIMGAPGAGKGTQAVGIAKHYGVPAISTGDMFRDNVKNGTPLGKQVDAIMKAGDFVPDELTEQIVADRLDQPDAQGGFLLDGFPRTMHQVDALDDYLDKHGHSLDAVISLDVDPEDLIARLLKRAELEGRADDNEETIRHRMEVYTSSTAPLLDAYKSRGLLVAVDGNGTVDEVGARIAAAVDAKVGR